ncbi:MAG: streptogrisin [Pseudonocardiales bacterium]|nr:streptogrisin [Pseudonocardiales bacterium]
MLVRSHRRVLAAAIGVVLSVGVAVPASAAPASPEPISSAQRLLALQGLMAVLDARSRLVPNSVTGWYVDPASNSVVVSTTDDAAARTFTAGQRNVRIEHVNARPRLLADLRGGDTITTSVGGRCSVGFNAISGRTRYVITAGHCTKLGGTWSGPDGTAIGPVAKTTFPGHDFGLVEVTSKAWQQTHDVDSDDGYLNVAGDAPAAVGDQVCLSGSTSGHHCGKVEAVDETVNYGDGDVVNGLTRTNMCAEAGDSGGSIMSGTQAQGTLSGGTGGCLLGGQTYYQPIREVLSAYGLTLLTGPPSADER